MGSSPSSASSTDPKSKRGRGRPATDPVVIEVFHRLLDWDVPTARAAVLCKLPKRGKPKKQPEALGRNLQVKLLADRKSATHSPSVAPYVVARGDWKNIPNSALRLLAQSGNRSGKFERMVAAHYFAVLSLPGAPDADYWTRLEVAAAALRKSVALSEKALWAFMLDHQRAAEEASRKSAADMAAHLAEYKARAPLRRAEEEALIARLNAEAAVRWPRIRALMQANPEGCARIGLDVSALPSTPPVTRARRPLGSIPLVTESEPPAAPWTRPDPDEFLAASEQSWGRPSKRAETPEWLLEAWDRRYGKH